MSKDPNRFWWLSVVLVVASSSGFCLFERATFPASFGLVGGFVGFLLGAALAAVLEDFFDQNLK